jgi:hypothetical protein
VEQSESRTLNTSIYGSTFVTRSYVEQVVREELVDRKILAFLPRTLNEHQDIYVIGPAAEVEVEGVNLTLPRAFLDELEREGERVRYRGWGLSTVSSTPVPIIRGFVNDDLVCETTPNHGRQDLVDLFGEGVRQCGFQDTFPWRDEMRGRVFTLEVEDDRGIVFRVFRQMPS